MWINTLLKEKTNQTCGLKVQLYYHNSNSHAVKCSIMYFSIQCSFVLMHEYIFFSCCCCSITIILSKHQFNYNFLFHINRLLKEKTIFIACIQLIIFKSCCIFKCNTTNLFILKGLDTRDSNRENIHDAATSLYHIIVCNTCAMLGTHCDC